MVEVKLVNHGCYRQLFPQPWVNTDILELEAIVPTDYIFRRMDVTRRHPFEDNSVDLIYSSHLLEHLPLDKCLFFLSEVHRTLKPGAWLRVTTPDLDLLIQALENEDMNRFTTAQPDLFSKVRSQGLKFSLIVFGNLGNDGTRPYTGHWNIFREDSLTELLELAGFSKVVRVAPGESMDRRFFDSGGYDMWVEGRDAHTLIMEAQK